MSNPFKSNELNDKGGSRYFTDSVTRQLEMIAIGESSLMDVIGRDIGTARMAINYCSKKLGFKFSTKTSDGKLWVKRIS